MGGSEAPQPARRTRRRKQLTLVEAQREELRDSLKVLVIWLVGKGCEPAFDYTLGYVLPLYNVLKAIALLIFAHSRVQLSLHLFDSFVVPLSRPNTPLVNSTAFTSLLFPTLRFMLSLPFSHVAVTVKHALVPLISHWTGPALPEDEQSTAVGARSSQPSRGWEADRVPPPVMHSESRKASTSSLRRDNRRGPGTGGMGNILKPQRSMDSLSSSRPSTMDVRAQKRSASSRLTPGAQSTFAQLQALPSVPRELPSQSKGRVTSSSSAKSTATALPPTFAQIPMQTPVKPFATQLPPNIVLPPTNRVHSHLTPVQPFSPVMPGSMGGGGGGLQSEGMPVFGQQGSPTQGYMISEGREDISPGNRISQTQSTALHENPSGSRVMTSETSAHPTADRSVRASPSSAKSSPKRKRKADQANESTAQDGKAAETRPPPSKRSRGRGEVATIPKKAKAAAVDVKPTEEEVAETAKSSAMTRSRSKPSVRAKQTEASEGAGSKSTIRARRKPA